MTRRRLKFEPGLKFIPNVIQESVNGNAGASDLQQATPLAKQAMCSHMVDAAGCKGEDAGAASSRLLNHVRYNGCPTQSEPIFQSRAVYSLRKYF